MVDGWEAFSETLATARAELAAAAPDSATAVEAEDCLLRLTTASLNDAFLAHHFRDGGLSRPIPTMGGPNPDYILSSAPINPTRRYRLDGCLHDSERVGVGLYSFGAGGAMLLAGYAVFDRDSLSADGCFSLDLAADAAGPGSLAIPPECRVMIIRTLHRNPRGRACSLSLASGNAELGLSPATDTVSLTTRTLPGGLAQASKRLLGTVRQFIEWSRLICAHPNYFTTPAESIAAAVRGDPDTNYYFGYYDLADGECLEVLIPEGVGGYWSLHAYNHWLESLPGAGFHDLNAVPDADGRIRLRIGPGIAPAPPEISNPVDTQGRKRGVLIYRTINEEKIQLPEAKLLRVDHF